MALDFLQQDEATEMHHLSLREGVTSPISSCLTCSSMPGLAVSLATTEILGSLMAIPLPCYVSSAYLIVIDIFPRLAMLKSAIVLDELAKLNHGPLNQSHSYLLV